MEPHPTKRVELYLPMRTVLIVAAAIAVMAAFAEIGEIIPDRLRRRLPRSRLRVPRALRDREDRVVAWASGNRHGARHRGHGDRPGAPVPRPAGRVGEGLPPAVADDRRGPPLVGRALVARRYGGRRERSVRGEQRSRFGSGRNLCRARRGRQLLHGLPDRLHGALHLPLPPERRHEPQAVARKRAHAG